MDCQQGDLRDFLQTNGGVVLQRVDNNNNLRYFSENEILHITIRYGSILGKGAFGEVYKGMLDDGSTVAVKRYIHATRKEEFAKEVIVHSQINHKNVVKLLGCCTEENALMIIMEFVSNGNLDSILHCSNINDRIPLPLWKRLDIAIQAAEALWCMHSMYNPVLHGDIKPANILLDENLAPKISDFGIARLLCATDGAQHTTNIIGSRGYMDPAYLESGVLTPKSDVYSFGVVLLEIITRKKAVDGTVILAQCFTRALQKGENVLHMFDEEINDTKNIKFLGEIGKVASKCLTRDVEMRPEMIEAVTSLRIIRNALQREQGTPSQQCTVVPDNSILLTKVGSAAQQFGNLNIFKEEEIKKMTKNYRMVFREDSCERLYNGILVKDHPVIVRQLRTRSETDREIFLKTMSILSQKSHKNVANVVGFHLGKSISECVYESCCDLSESKFGSMSLSNRNLYDTICSMEKLPLHLRLSIAVQCAEGLVHIHLLAAENPDLCGTSLLGNFRSANIFLDKNLVPKVFNVNLSTFLGLSAVRQNTISAFRIYGDSSKNHYSDPRDVSGELFNPKSDVYSFGVVLFELITWKTVRYMADGRAHMLTMDFLNTYKRDRNAIEIFGKAYDEQGECFLHEAMAIVVQCLQLDFQKRPKMSDVLSRLRMIAAAQSIRSKLIVGGNNEPAPVEDTTKTQFKKKDTTKTLPTAVSNISKKELDKITRKFSGVLIGKTLYARVFIGVVNGQKSAVKMLEPNEEILVQVATISGMHKHGNVVQLLGYFIEGKTRVLAYEYSARGSLHDILHGKEGVQGVQPRSPLSWLQRVKIAVSAAQGLEFLHEKADPRIIHTNIKSSNILLFDNDVAKIGDLGVSKQLAPNKHNYHGYDTIIRPPCGLSHQAPECTMTGNYSIKSDVYSFGVVLLELLTGRKVFDGTLPYNQNRLVNWVKPRLSESRLKECIDPRLLEDGYPAKVAAKMAAVAALCLEDDIDFRPSMNIVVRALSPLLNLSQQWFNGA